MASVPSFTRSLVAEGPRLLIRSVCAACGESKLVSKHDGSLELWETGHCCAAKKEAASVPRAAADRTLSIVGKRDDSALS